MITKEKRIKPISITLSETAFCKIMCLVRNFDGEIGWHGTVTREYNNNFVINDIFVYPQIVTPISITTDQVSYENWLMSQDDDVFNNLRMHGHSHANLSVIPSFQDKYHRDRLVEQLGVDMFYIFMVWNKKYEVYSLLYDYNSRTVYNSNHIVVNVVINNVKQKFKRNKLIINFVNTIEMKTFIEKVSSVVVNKHLSKGIITTNN